MRRSHLLVASSLVALLSTPVFAQGKAAADDSGSGEIVVTAQKRTERLQDIPVSASVLSSATIQQQHVTDLSDINRAVPSVQIKGTFNGRVPYGMRGISTNANEGAIGLTSGVNIEIDGIPVPADSFAANTLSDISQLEVLKGPQATLGGRTASAGTVNFVTSGPSKTAKGSFAAVMTNDGEYRVDAAFSGPITNGVSFSLAGYASRTPYQVYNLNNKQQSRSDNRGVRAKLKFEIGDNFDMQLMGHYALATSVGGNFTGQYFAPNTALFPFIPNEFNGPGGSPSYFGIRPSVAFPGITMFYGNTQYASPVAMSSRYEDKDASLILNYHIGETTISSTTSFFREEQFQTQDTFLTNVYFFDVLTHGNAPHYGNVQSNTGYVKQWTQEFKVATDASKPLSLLAGAFFSDMTVVANGLRVWVANPIAKTNISTTKNYSLYARVTGKLSDQFSVIGGLRYNKDKIGWNITEFFNPPAGQFYSCNPNFDGAAGTGVPAGCAWNLNDSSSALVGDISLQYRPSKDAMIYASYTRGYKPRAFNTVHDFSSFQTGPIYLPTQAALTAAQVKTAQNAYISDLTFATPTGKETIDSFELGAKTSLMDRRLTFNVAAFYTNYRGYQAQLFDTSKVIGTLILANAGASTKGLEIDTNWRSGNTSIGLSAAYIDAKFKNFANAVCWPGQTAAQGCITSTVNGITKTVQDLTGKALPDSPKFKLNLTLEQIVPMNKVDLVLGSNLSYRSDTNMQGNQNPFTRQPGFALVDLSIGLQTKDKRASITFFVNNLTNHFYLTDAEDFFSGAMGGGVPGSANFQTGGNYVIGQPARDAHRYFGGRVNFKF